MNPEKSIDFVRYLNLILLAISLFMIFSFENTNKFSSKLLKSFGLKEIDHSKEENRTKMNWPRFLLLIPVILLMYYDYDSDSWTNMVGLNKLTGNKLYNHIIRLFGLYGVVYTFSAGLGIKRGLNQVNISSLRGIRFMIIWAICFAFTKNRSEGLMGAIAYSVLRSNVSNDILVS